jgi:CheY-like chemotaxis protein
VIVFVSYQRADTLYAAHAVGYALRLAGHEAFVDTGSISRGEHYIQVISTAVSNAHVMLAMVGADFTWARLSEPTSVVAFEWRRAQFHGSGVVPVLVDDGKIPPDESLPPELRWFTKRDAYTLRAASLSADIKTLVDDIPLLAGNPRRAARVLWVDDRPANNERERKLLRPHGIVFDNVVSTEEALAQLSNESYDLVITDLGRRGSSDLSSSAGAAFLEHPVVKQGGPPVIVYAGKSAVTRRPELVRRGAADATNDPLRLIDAVLRTLGRAPESPNGLTR